MHDERPGLAECRLNEKSCARSWVSPARGNLPPKRVSVDCHAVLLPLHISQNAAEVSRGSEWSTAPYPYGSWL